MSLQEKHLSLGQFAKQLNISTNLARKILDGEPGIIRIGRPESRFKRAYITIRIPESVATRVYLRLQRKAS